MNRPALTFGFGWLLGWAYGAFGERALVAFGAWLLRW